MRLNLIVGAILVVALLGAVACGGDDDQTPTPSASASVAASASASVTPGVSAAPTVTAALTNAEGALAGVTDIIRRANEARCPTPAPGAPICVVVSLDSSKSPTDFDHGIVAYAINDPQQGGKTIVVGKTPEGRWSQYLWGNPLYNANPTYNPTALPGGVTICAFGGAAKVYASYNPSSAEVGSVQEGATPTADNFVLTQPGTIANAGVNIQGYGWYHLTDPAGWVYSKYVAEGPGCALHDELERP